MGIPPWLQGTSPQDYVAAAEHGAQIGLGIAHARNAAQEASERNATEREAIAERANSVRSEQALREWETRERMKLSLAQEQAHEQQAQATLAQGGQYNLARLALETAQNKAREDAINETTRHHGVLEKQGQQRLNPETGEPELITTDLGNGDSFIHMAGATTGHIIHNRSTEDKLGQWLLKSKFSHLQTAQQLAAKALSGMGEKDPMYAATKQRYDDLTTQVSNTENLLKNPNIDLSHLPPLPPLEAGAGSGANDTLSGQWADPEGASSPTSPLKFNWNDKTRSYEPPQ